MLLIHWWWRKWWGDAELFFSSVLTARKIQWPACLYVLIAVSSQKREPVGCSILPENAMPILVCVGLSGASLDVDDADIGSRFGGPPTVTREINTYLIFHKSRILQLFVIEDTLFWYVLEFKKVSSYQTVAAHINIHSPLAIHSKIFTQLLIHFRCAGPPGNRNYCAFRLCSNICQIEYFILQFKQEILAQIADHKGTQPLMYIKVYSIYCL
jgi:hypothetical protein